MKKVLKWLGISILVILLLMIFLPIIFRGTIIKKVKEGANKSLNAKMDFGKLGLSLFSNFPDISLSIEDLSIINMEPFAGDTLVYAKKLDVSLDLMSVIKGDQVKIRTVDIDSPVMNFLVTKAGKANWDISKPSTDQAKGKTSSTFNIKLKKYSLSNGRIVYDDKALGFYLGLEGVNHTGNGDFTQDLFTLSTHTNIASTNISYGGIPYIVRVKSTLDADLDVGMKDFKFSFHKNKLILNELYLDVDGWIAMPDTNIDMDLKFSVTRTDFKNFISLIPAVYSKSFRDVSATGKMSFDGWAKGRYNASSLPGFGLNLDIGYGGFKYTMLPAEVKNVFVTLKIKNPDGIKDHTTIDLPVFHFVMAGDVFDAKLSLKTPVSDPDIDASFSGKINLNNIKQIVPLDAGTSLNGIITADLALKGKSSAVKNKDFQNFSASGNFSVVDMNYAAPELKQPLTIRTLGLYFSPKVVTLNSLDLRTGNVIVQANGSLENFIPYMLTQGEVLVGKLNMATDKINLNEWMSADAKAAASSDTTSMNAFEVPGNIDFALSAIIHTLIYEDIKMTDVSGVITLANKAVSMKNLSMKLLDGSLTMNGSYATPNPKKPDINFNLSMTDFDIRKTAAAFPVVQKMAPITKSCTGQFSGKMDLKGNLDEHLNPVIPSLTGSGVVNTSQVTIQNFPPVQKIADALKMASLQKLDIPKTMVSFKFANGRVFIDPFDVSLNGFKSKIGGSNGFDQTIDYTMNVQIPHASFGGEANSVLDNLLSQASSKGANFKVGDLIPVELKIGGTVLSPKVGTDINKQGAKAMADLKTAAAAEFAKKKAEGEARAKEEAGKLKAQAESKAKEEADRLKKEAEAKAKSAADSLKKAAEQKAKDALKGLNPFK